jgi:hypothetical protein
MMTLYVYVLQTLRSFIELAIAGCTFVIVNIQSKVFTLRLEMIMKPIEKTKGKRGVRRIKEQKSRSKALAIEDETCYACAGQLVCLQ